MINLKRTPETLNASGLVDGMRVSGTNRLRPSLCPLTAQQVPALPVSPGCLLPPGAHWSGIIRNSMALAVSSTSPSSRGRTSAPAPWGTGGEWEALVWSMAGPALCLLSSAGAFSLTMAAAQCSSAMCKVSCATPGAALVLGLGGTMAASVAAGRAGEMAMKAAGIRTTDDAAMRWADAAVGCAAFVLLGGRFPRVLMSDVRFVGANATRSIPAAGSQYANASQKARLQAIFDRHGCHTCGTRRRNVGVVADHQPPTKLNYGTGGANASAELTRRRGWLAPLLPPPPKQRYFPQCATCSNRQSSAVARCCRSPAAGTLGRVGKL